MDSSIIVALIGGAITIFNVVFTSVSAHNSEKKRRADV